MKNIFLLIACLLAISVNGQNKNKEDEFVNSLLKKMTLDEKIGQTVLYTSGYDHVTGPTIDPDYKEYLKKGLVGGIFNAVGAAHTKELQKIAVEETRLGIPLIFGYDVIHGHSTIFPIPLAEACSWDLEAIKQSSRIAAKEATAQGLNWVFAPMVDVARDARWGRIAEGAGEDPYLGSLIAAARVKGTQGDNLNNNETAAACVKHYAAYGAALAGRDYNAVDMSENELRNIYLPPFKAALDAGSATIMTAFNDLNGVPASGDSFLLKQILLDEWKFNGFVVTDYTSISEMITHGYATDEKHSAEIAMNAGVNMDMQSGVFMKYLKELVAEGKVSEEDITNSTRKILKLKYQLGLFEDPYRYSNEKREIKDLMTVEHKEAARDMARKSFVLLKNENKLLPLKKNQKIALIGPLAKDKYEILGCWSAMGDRVSQPVSVFEGLTREGVTNIFYAKGCEIQSNDTIGFAEARKVALKSDVIVLVMGEFHNMSGENNSRTNLDLPGNQLHLLKEMKKLNKPMVLILFNGRPLTITWENDNIDAILEAWFPGTMGGAAIADVLLGKYNPSGKLVTTFPRAVGQIPLFYNHKNTGRPYDPNVAELAYGSRYWDVTNDPLYPFGYGLSYTQFSYSDFNLSSGIITENKPLKASVKVTNTGDYDGEEIVQLYVRDLVGSVTRPVKELKGFKKIYIEKGKSKTVEFEISVNDLKFYNNKLHFVFEKGDFDIFVGGDSSKLLKNTFILE